MWSGVSATGSSHPESEKRGCEPWSISEQSRPSEEAAGPKCERKNGLKKRAIELMGQVGMERMGKA